MRNDYFWPLILIGVGVLLLLSNLGILVANIWGMLWPLLLIALGGWVLWNALAGAQGQAAAQPAAIPLDGAARARLRIRHGAGRLSVQGGAAEGVLLSGAFTGGVETQVRRDGDELNVRLQPPDGVARLFGPGRWGAPDGLRWDMALTQQAELELDLETGASETRLALADLRVVELRVKTGASATEVTLPSQAGFTRVRIASGAASVKIQVPEAVAARIRVDSGLAGIDVDTARFYKRGDGYESPGYESAANRVEMEIETGVGSVSVH